jgi:hypothetical protein
MDPELCEFLLARRSSEDLIFSTHISAAHELQRDVRAEFTDVRFLADPSKKRSLSASMFGKLRLLISRWSPAREQNGRRSNHHVDHWLLVARRLEGMWGVGINGIDGRNMTDNHGYISLWQLYRFHLSH